MALNGKRRSFFVLYYILYYVTLHIGQKNDSFIINRVVSVYTITHYYPLFDHWTERGIVWIDGVISSMSKFSLNKETPTFWNEVLAQLFDEWLNILSILTTIWWHTWTVLKDFEQLNNFLIESELWTSFVERILIMYETLSHYLDFVTVIELFKFEFS